VNAQNFHKLIFQRILFVQLLASLILVAAMTACEYWEVEGSKEIAVPFEANITFTSDRDGSDDIYILSTEDGSLVNLTADSSENAFPAWSPDGEHIAFLSNRDGDFELYVMDVKTRQLRKLSDNDVDDWTRFAWAPDSSLVAFDSSIRGNRPEIYLFDVEDGVTTSVTNNDVTDGNPVWSPDGSQIAFVAARVGSYDLVILELETGRTTPLLTDEPWISNLDWSPGGGWITFETSRQDGTPRVDAISIDGSTRFSSINDDLAAGNPVWSPDGQWIAFVGGPVDSGLSQLFIVKRDGSELRNLVADGAINRPNWSSDGKWIAFTGVASKMDRRPGDLDIYVVSVETKEIINLTSSKGDDRDPDWRP
jgi:Tol biopolymer transport system component